MAERDGNYVPRYPQNNKPRLYTLRITSEKSAVNRFPADIIVKIFGVDNRRFEETNAMRLVGRWDSVGSHTITATGGGLFYFDYAGSATLTHMPTYVNEKDEIVWSADEVMYLTSIPRTIAFAVGDGGSGTQLQTPCNNGNCVEAGRISWRCTASSFGQP